MNRMILAFVATFVLGACAVDNNVADSPLGQSTVSLPLTTAAGNPIPGTLDPCPGDVFPWQDLSVMEIVKNEAGEALTCVSVGAECDDSGDATMWANGVQKTLVTHKTGLQGYPSAVCWNYYGSGRVCAFPKDDDHKAGPNFCDPDNDGDGWKDNEDNCPDVPNPNQADNDGDGIGDACDPDIDGDGDLNENDNCRYVSNSDQVDTDGNCPDAPYATDPQCGDACVDDADGDGVLDEDDNCPLVSNAHQADFDEDGLGDACDPDDDNDLDPDSSDCAPLDPAIHAAATEVCDGIDNNCNGQTDENFVDTDFDGAANCVDPDDDGDGVLDNEDNCPLIINPNQENIDGDSFGDACDADIDGDGIGNNADNCPMWVNTNQADFDEDGLGDICDFNCSGATMPDPNTGEIVEVNQVTDLPNTWCTTGVNDADLDDFSPLEGDCNDGNSNINPDALEVCDGIDNNCDGMTDEGADALCGPAQVCQGKDGCVDVACTPICGGMECGDDGCGGTCGTCGNGLVCEEGACVACVGNGDCNDGNLCTVDACVANACVFTVKSCGDGNACTTDSCNQANGACLNTPKVCDDSNLCTTDACVAGTCQFTPVVCSDGKACNSTSGVCETPPVIPDAPLAIVFDNVSFTSWKVYVSCWGNGTSGNFVGWDTSVACASGETCLVDGADGQLLFEWLTAGDGVFGCDANVQDMGTGKWAPGCNNADCSSKFGANIETTLYYKGVGYPMSVTSNGVGGLVWHWNAAL